MSVEGTPGAGRLRPAGRRRGVAWAAASAASAVVVAGVIGGIPLAVEAPERVVTTPAPADDPPVEDPVAEPATGTVVHAPSGRPRSSRTSAMPVWQAFDQDAGLFLHAWEGATRQPRASDTARRTGRITRPGQDQPVATILCEVECGWAPSFGPGPHEITVLEERATSGGHGRRRACCTVHVYGFDGVLRDRFGLGSAVRGAGVADLEWSADGSRLAISTFSGGPREPGCPVGDCDASEAFLWTMERGGLPVLRYQQSVPLRPRAWDNPILTSLAWSPDGERVGFVATSWLPERAGPPTLIAFDVVSGQAQTLHEFDDCGTCDPTRWGFSWSPDGRRIAVTDGERVDRLYSDGTATHAPLGNGSGPLAWLARPRVDPSPHLAHP
jgi:hypothetical protein